MDPNETKTQEQEQPQPQEQNFAPVSEDIASLKETAAYYTAQDSLDQPPESQAPSVHIEWQASEYLHHEKSFGWFAVFFLATALVIAIMYLILKDILSVIVIALMSIALAVFANRQPRTLAYAINENGLSIGEKKYSFNSFRSFSVLEDEGVDNIVVDPIQKFMPPITIYCAPEDMEKIVEVLTYYLPHEDKKLDWVDRFAKRIRF